MRQQIAVYDGIKIPRTNEADRRLLFSVGRVKKHPKYVHGKIGMAVLLHKIDHVEARWWDYDYNYLLRLQSPILTAHTICGMSWRISSDKSRICEIPKPDAVLCGRCHGQPRNFPRGETPKIPRALAKIRLGCISEGIANEA